MPEVATVRDLRRAQIVEAARKVVAEEGLEGLTIGTLEERLPFTRGVITYHFRDKDEILRAVLESAIEEIDAATFREVSASRDLEEKLRAVMRSTIRGFLDHKEATLILFSFWGRAAADPRVAEANNAMHALYRKRSAALLKEGKAQGRFRDVPTEAFAALMVAIVSGIVTQATFDPAGVDAEDAVREACRTLMARVSLTSS